MAKIYYTNGTGAEQTKSAAVKPQFPVYDTLLDAEKDIDNLDVGQEIAVPDEFNIADAVGEIIDTAIDTHLENKGSPIGTIISYRGNLPEGYLNCDGTEFSVDDYPLLYGQLRSSRVPFLFDLPENYEYGKEYLVDWIDGRPVFRVDWIDDGQYSASNLSTSWYNTAGPGGNLNWFSEHNFDRIISSEVRAGHSGTSYESGQQGGYIVQWDSSTKYLKWYYLNQTQGTNSGDGKPRIFSIKYFRTDNSLEDCEEIHYKAIKWSSGVAAESDTNITEAIESAVQTIENYNPNPVGSYLKLEKNTVTPAGYLLADGSTFDETEYPLLYNYLGSNVLPYKSNMDSISSTPDVAISTRSNYNPYKVQYVSNLQNYFNEAGLDSAGDGFPYDGYLFVETYHWYFLWIEDTDGTIVGYMTATRDDTQSTLWIPIKKGQKIYGWNRNGSSTPTPATSFVQSSYTKFYIWYAKTQQYIKAVSGLESQSTEAQEVANAVNSAEASFSQKFAAIKSELTAAIRKDETVLAEADNNYTHAIVAGTNFNDSILNYDRVMFYCRRSASSTADMLPVFEITHEQAVDMVNNASSYSILIPGYASEYREIKFDSTGTKVTAVSGSECVYKVIGVGKR